MKYDGSYLIKYDRLTGTFKTNIAGLINNIKNDINLTSDFIFMKHKERKSIIYYLVRDKHDLKKKILLFPYWTNSIEASARVLDESHVNSRWYYFCPKEILEGADETLDVNVNAFRQTCLGNDTAFEKTRVPKVGIPFRLNKYNWGQRTMVRIHPKKYHFKYQDDSDEKAFRIRKFHFRNGELQIDETFLKFNLLAKLFDDEDGDSNW